MEADIPLTRRLAQARVPLVLWLCLAVLLWQALLVQNRARIPDDYRAMAATGLNPKQGLRFLYFYRNFGVFPVAVTGVPEHIPDNADPRSVLAQVAPLLRNDINEDTNWGRAGDYGRIYLYWPSLLLGAAPEHASVKPFHALLFLFSLLAVLLAFHRRGRLAQGLALVILLGSSSFQLFEAYRNENEMSLSISVALLTFALNFCFFGGPAGRPRTELVLAALTGLFLATVHQVRTEPAMIALTVLPLYLLASPRALPRRLGLCAAFAAAYLAASAAWSSHFRAMQREAAAFVKEHGGRPFEPTERMHHPVWHPFFCGLGDFGSDRGYAWNDDVAYAYAIAPLKKTQGPHIAIYKGYLINRLDPEAPYPVRVEGLPEYDAILREKIIGDISADPLWYAGILAKRVGLALTDSLPAELNFVWFRLRIPLGLWVLALALPLFVRRRMEFETKAVLFFLPLSLTAILIFSKRGNTYFQIGHLVAIALALPMVWQWTAGWRERLATSFSRASRSP